jgi:hypothetical protein
MDIELDCFKKEINLVAYVASRNFSLDKKNSSKKTTVMRRGNEKIAISRGHNGQYIYNDLKNNHKGGSIIDFCQKELGQNLGYVRKELRRFSGIPQTKHTFYQPAPKLSKTEQQKILKQDELNAVKIDKSIYLENRGITQETLNDPRFKNRVFTDRRGNICFPHANQHGFSGLEKKNINFTGFSSGGSKGTWKSNSLKTTELIIFCESAIDALSHAQLHCKNIAEYHSLGGQFSPEQEKLIKKIVRENPGKIFVLAFDNDDDGKKYAERFKKLLKPIELLLDFPNKKDWNEELTTYIKNLSVL